MSSRAHRFMFNSNRLTDFSKQGQVGSPFACGRLTGIVDTIPPSELRQGPWDDITIIASVAPFVEGSGRASPS